MRGLAVVRGAVLAGVVAMCVGFCGCGLFGPSRPSPAPGPYAGPPVSVEVLDGVHTVRMEAPTAGWSMELDDEQLRDGGRDVFITIESPDPAYEHAQAQVEQFLTTRVPSHTPITVYARLRERGPGGSTAGYRLAARVPTPAR